VRESVLVSSEGGRNIPRLATVIETAGPDDGEAPDEEIEAGEGLDGRATRAQKRRERRREEILVAAKHVFARRGFHEASVAHIISEAQIARGTFYLYFSSKSDVFQELLDEFLSMIRSRVRRISLDPNEGAPIDQLRDNFRRIFTVAVEHEEVAATMLQDPSAFDEESRELAKRFDAQVTGLIEGAIRVGQALGVIRECDVHLAAIAALASVRAALRRLLHERAAGESEDQTSPERVADDMMAFIIEGLAAGEELRGLGKPRDER
jgi:AcrR family transcriptional regulator